MSEMETSEMETPILESGNVVIKEELVIKEEPQIHESDLEDEYITADPLFTIADIKSEPVEMVAEADCEEYFLNECHPDADSSNSQFLLYQSDVDVPAKGGERTLYRCKFCPKTYKRLGNFTTHAKSHSTPKTTKTYTPPAGSSKDQTLMCPLCSFETKSYAVMRDHHQNMHPSASKQQARETKGNAESTSPDGIFQCGVCFRKLDNLASFFSHRKLHEKSVCEECGNTTTYNSVLHKLSHLGEALHRCHHCNKHFSLNSTLAMHEKIHSNVESYNCDICQEKFVWFYQLLNHKKIHSSKESDVFDMIYKIKASYSPNGHWCQKCGKSFDDIVEYCKHSVVHYEEEKKDLVFKCYICDQPFDDVVFLLDHIKQHK